MTPHATLNTSRSDTRPVATWAVSRRGLRLLIGEEIDHSRGQYIQLIRSSICSLLSLSELPLNSDRWPRVSDGLAFAINDDGSTMVTKRGSVAGEQHVTVTARWKTPADRARVVELSQVS